MYRCTIHDLPQRLRQHKRKVNLVLTSPPYPGTHVLYNRWQIHGRGETDLPYALLHLRDGQASSFYTFGDRKEAENRTYFLQMEKGFQNLRGVLEKSALIAQVISFPDPRRQLSQYRQLMQRAGYKEVVLDETHRGELRREIPNRKWYATCADAATSAKEYVIIHRPG